MCIVDDDEIHENKPEGLSYSGMSEFGVHYYRKSDNTHWIETRRCKDGKTVFVKV